MPNPPTTRDLVAALEGALYTSPETAPFLLEVERDESLHRLLDPFREGYAHAADEAHTALRKDPAITPERLLARLRDAQRETDASWALELKAQGVQMNPCLVDWDYGWRLGHQAVITILARAIYAGPS